MTALRLRWVKIGLAAALAAPYVWLGWAGYVEAQAPGSVLGADPTEAILRYLGEWGLRILLLTLCVSPLRRLTGWTWLVRTRRMIGLFAFSYLLLHLLAYLWFFAEFDWTLLLGDVSGRPYITVGFTALLILAALAVTSTRGWQRRLGGRWQTLHRGIYLATALGLLHLWWLTKAGYGDWVAYTLVASGLLSERLYRGHVRRGRKRGVAHAAGRGSAWLRSSASTSAGASGRGSTGVGLR